MENITLTPYITGFGRNVKISKNFCSLVFFFYSPAWKVSQEPLD